MIKGIRNIREIQNLRGKRVLLRLDLNVPILNGEVENDFRIIKSLPTVRFLRDGGAKIIILSHIWEHESITLRPVYSYLKSLIDLIFVEDCIGDVPKEIISKMNDGDIILLENLRKYKKEEKGNDPDFTEKLSSLGDIYVNDAFSSSHREHSSIVGLPKFLPHYSGFLFDEETTRLSEVMNPEKPFLFILGGAKFETKIPLVIKYLDKADYVYVAGALATDFFKAKGYKTGLSLISGKDYGLEEYLDKENLILPRDVTVRNKRGVFVKKPRDVEENDQIMDIGAESIEELKKLIKKSKFILWNGPLGDYEEGFRDGTINLAKAIMSSHVRSVIGGGDTFAVISKLEIENEFRFVSTAGGALLEFLYSGTLPGIEALKEH